MKKGARVSTACLFLIALPSIALFSQEQYGNVRGVVVDKDNAPLPGVTVTLESPLFAARAQTTSEAGHFRFINITAGVYSLTCTLSGYKTHVQKVLDIRVGTNFDLKIAMTQAVLAESVTVEAVSPIVDTKKSEPERTSP